MACQRVLTVLMHDIRLQCRLKRPSQAAIGGSSRCQFRAQIRSFSGGPPLAASTVIRSRKRLLAEPLTASVSKPSFVSRRSASSSSSTSQESFSCPACSHTIDTSARLTAQCPECSTFLPPSSDASYFKLLGQPTTYACDKAGIRREFLKWQGVVHPDRLSSLSSDGLVPVEQQENYAKAWSALVNEAYKTLTNDVSRGEYLLSLRGVRIEEQDKMEDPALLMEILEVREALEEAISEEEVQQIRQQNRDATADVLQTLEDCLSAPKLDVDACKECLMRLRYMDNVENVCKEWQPGKRIVLQH